jgi:hypothetical protein
MLSKDGKQTKRIVETGSLKKDKLDPEVRKASLVTNNCAIIPARKKGKSKIGVICVN